MKLHSFLLIFSCGKQATNLATKNEEWNITLKTPGSVHIIGFMGQGLCGYSKSCNLTKMSALRVAFATFNSNFFLELELLECVCWKMERSVRFDFLFHSLL